MVVVIDNYDSFTYNLVQRLGELGAELKVYRNDKTSIEQVESDKPDHIIISPGPCTPREAGISCEVIKHFAGKVPILGVCLGHQAVGAVYGGKIIGAPELMHGKTSMIYHGGEGIYKEVCSPFQATRYHSLVVDKKSLPDILKITAWTEDQVIMGLRHREYPLEGIQFHPESILTGQGKKILLNFLRGGKELAA